MIDHFCIVNAADREDAEATAKLSNASVPHMDEDFKPVTRKELTELVVPNLKADLIKAKNFDNLVACMGHLQNGSQTTVSIWQDYATLSEEAVHLTIGKNNYLGPSLSACILKAVEAGEHERF